MRRFWSRVNRRFKLRYRIEYCAVKSLYYMICGASPDYAWHVARRMGRIAWRLGVRRRTVLTNLRIAFPEKSEESLAAIGKRSYEHLAQVVVDIMLTRRMVTKNSYRRRIRITGWAQDYLERHGEQGLRERARGIVFTTGHFGNWELSSGVFSLLGVSMAPVYRMPENPWLARFLKSLRLDAQSEFIERRGAVNEMLRHLGAGGNVGFLFDQEALWGHRVKFFGTDSVTHKTPAVLARDYGFPIFFGVMIRTGPMQYEGRGELLELEKTDDREADLQRFVQVLASRLEAQVREHPEQYLWAHRRWKHTGAHDAHKQGRMA